MKKYIALVLTVVLSFGSYTHGATVVTIPQALEALKSAKAVHVTAATTTRWSGEGVSQPFILDIRYDATTPHRIRAEQRMSMGMLGDIPMESKLDGDTWYFSFPEEYFNGGLTGASTPSLAWIKVTPKDIKALKKKNEDVSGLFEAVGPMNQERMLEYFESTFQYQKSLQLKKTGTRVVDGSSIDTYSMTINKAALKNQLSEIYRYGGPLDATAIKAINEQIAAIRFRNGVFSVYSGTMRPYMISGIYETLSKGKVVTSSDFKVTFTDYDKPITITPPKKWITLTKAYSKLNGSNSESRTMAEAAAVKASMASFRAAAELVYDQSANTYGTKQNSSSCTSPTKGSLFNPNDSEQSDMIQNLLSSVKTYATDTRCSSTTVAWAWSAKLPTGEYWCVDSTGISKAISGKHAGLSCE